ncbi:hypothetical protein B0H17DRAFT_8712 [Mycena rosella]|uniref:Uncharacterized protein n=1 Tax=Mycena rosella TaxID=1033263 RepID=A0AAD7M756_MYCRO|nr:hypothetical protein B0H17DRAFT_8712 [Mycena rosella]
MFALSKSTLVLAAVLAVRFQAANALGAFFCNDINYKTDCAHWTDLVDGKCYTLDAGHQDKVSSFGPDSGTQCVLSPDYHCADAHVTVNYPGSADLRNVDYAGGIEVNDNMNSFVCSPGFV